MTALTLIGLVTAAAAVSPAGEKTDGELFREDFTDGMGKWTVELEKGGTVEAKDGKLVIDVPAGCSVWFKPLLEGPIVIEYEATAISAGGPNDRVSDLNCFWMARDARHPEDIFAQPRSGKFADYDQLRCYYVGFGGNGNTTTRFRRYIGERSNRPLLPEHDLKAPLLEPNLPQKIRIISEGSHVTFFQNGKQIFTMNDPAPYISGWFAFRTVTSHLEIRHFHVTRITPSPSDPAQSR